MVVEQRLYRLDPPLVDDYKAHEFVISSAATVPFSGPETYIFPATPDGEITDFRELDGSRRGRLDCDGVLRDLGYEIVEAP